MQGKDAPGVGEYYPPREEIRKPKAPSWKMGKSERFHDQNQETKELISRLPCLYSGINMFGDKKLSFPRADRFREKSPKEIKEEVQPGPADYKVEKYKSIAS